MTIKEAAKAWHNIYATQDDLIEDSFRAGAKWMRGEVLAILDEMFMQQGSISVDDWFRDSPNLFQGRVKVRKVCEQ